MGRWHAALAQSYAQSGVHGGRGERRPDSRDRVGREPSIPDRRPTTRRALSHGLIMSGQRKPRTGEAPSGDSDLVALTKSPGFWVIVRYAALFGVMLAFAALAFLGLVKRGTKLWFTLPKEIGRAHV